MWDLKAAINKFNPWKEEKTRELQQFIQRVDQVLLIDLKLARLDNETASEYIKQAPSVERALLMMIMEEHKKLAAMKEESSG